MSRWIEVDENIHQYISEHLPAEPEVLQALHERTANMEGAGMQISHEQAQFMRVLLQSLKAKNTIEIGVYTGYSTLITAQCLPEDGRVIACDISDEWTSIAKPFWQKAGQDSKIDLRLAPAAQTMKSLIAEGRNGSFDFVFIDADKTGYDEYYELALELLRPGGLIALDNCLWGGKVADTNNREEDTLALKTLNKKIASDSRVIAYLAPVGDGLYLASKC